jgi:hypothetical protein
MIIYLTPQNKAFNPNLAITIGDTQFPAKAFLNEDMRTLHGVTTKEVVVPEHDPDTQSRPVQGEDGEYAQPVDLPLEEAKARKKATINQIKSAKQLEGFTYDGMTFQCDEVSVSRIHATWSFAQADNTYTQPFVLKDNSTVTLTNAQCLGVGAACGQFVSGLTFTARQLKDAVIAATTVAEVRAVTWPE